MFIRDFVHPSRPDRAEDGTALLRDECVRNITYGIFIVIRSSNVENKYGRSETCVLKFTERDVIESSRRRRVRYTFIRVYMVAGT
jgi:hypothetical protein